jgi:hypothetical protein
VGEILGNFNGERFSSAAITFRQRCRIAVHPRSVKLLGIVEGSSGDIQASTTFFSEDNNRTGRG